MTTIIIGAGASGVLASYLLAKAGEKVLLLEKNHQIMNKIYATGNGRCNFTNRKIDLSNYHGQDPSFTHSVISRYDGPRMINLFASLGILHKELEGGRVYPLSLQAKTVPQMFEHHLARNEIDLRLNTEVVSVEKKADAFLVKGSEEEWIGKRLILATGSAAMKNLGSSDQGLTFAQNLGHPITRLFPGISQLKTVEGIPKKLVGAKLPARVSLLLDGQVQKTYESDLLFTDYGLSGPAILQHSARALEGKKKAELVLDLQIDKSREELDQILNRWKKDFPNWEVRHLLRGLIHNDLIDYLMFPKVRRREQMKDLSQEQIEFLLDKIKSLTFTVEGPRSEDSGQITCGGVDTTYIDPENLESKLHKGLYILGELLDVDGDCGGYNLHWAFASAWAASQSIIENRDREGR